MFTFLKLSSEIKETAAAGEIARPVSVMIKMKLHQDKFIFQSVSRCSGMIAFDSRKFIQVYNYMVNRAYYSLLKCAKYHAVFVLSTFRSSYWHSIYSEHCPDAALVRTNEHQITAATGLHQQARDGCVVSRCIHHTPNYRC